MIVFLARRPVLRASEKILLDAISVSKGIVELRLLEEGLCFVIDDDHC
jgi:hypothetical protein